MKNRLSIIRNFTHSIGIFLFMMSFLLILPSKSSANQIQEVEDDTLRVGLVLSGGGAKGIAHIGVIQMLEEAGVRIDYITGTSMGALVGGLYSIGYTSNQLIEIGRSSNWQELFSGAPARRYLSNYHKQFDQRTAVSFPIRERGLDLPAGIITGQGIYTFLSGLTWPVHSIDSFTDFPIPFSATATNLETGKPAHFRSGYLPDAIRASISIPSLMAPHEIADSIYVDGGVSNNLPVDQAIEMGANFIIAVNVASPLMPRDSLTTLSSILNQTANFFINEKIDEQKVNADIYITPEDVNKFDILDFDKVDPLVAAGVKGAEDYMEQFRELAALQTRPPPERPGIGEFVSLPFNRVIIRGNERISEQVIQNTLQIPEGSMLSPEFIENRVEVLISTQLFDLVTYQVVPDEEYFYNLQINVVENRTDIFRLGLRFETATQASILGSAEFRNLISDGSLTQFDLRLGDHTRFMADHLVYGAIGSKLGWRTSLIYDVENIDVYGEDERIAEFSNNLLRLEFSGGNYLASRSLIALGVRQDFIYFNNIINEEFVTKSDVDHNSVFGTFRIDRFNRKAFPNRGHNIVLDGTVSNEILFSPINFLSTSGLWQAYYDISSIITLRHMLFAGYSSGEELPWDYWFSLNRYDNIQGYVRFGGIRRYEDTARNVQTASFGVRFEPLYHRFIGVDFYAGRFQDKWNVLNFAFDDVTYGVSLSVGALTILGPFEVILSSGSNNSFLAEIQVGFQF